jgi:hypothetical protein
MFFAPSVGRGAGTPRTGADSYSHLTDIKWGNNMNALHPETIRMVRDNQRT